jgi:hypothetical protein
MTDLFFELLVAGLAMYYEPGLFEEVMHNRQLPPCVECIGYVALAEPAYIGGQVWLRPFGQAPLGPFYVVDVGPQDPVAKAKLQERGWAVDVDPATWQRLGLPKRPVPMEVLQVVPAWTCVGRRYC